MAQRTAGNVNEGSQDTNFRAEPVSRLTGVFPFLYVLSLDVLVQVDGVLASNGGVAVQSGLLGLRGLSWHFESLITKFQS